MISPIRAAADQAAPTVIAVIVDDSSSMPKNDPEGTAAFAAYQLVRMAPPNTLLGVFTFGSMKRGQDHTPLITVEDGRGRRGKANELKQKLQRNNLLVEGTPFAHLKPSGKEFHPYWGFETPCRMAITTAMKWVNAQDQGGPALVMFLSDGKCIDLKKPPVLKWKGYPKVASTEDRRVLALKSGRTANLCPVEFGTIGPWLEGMASNRKTKVNPEHGPLGVIGAFSKCLDAFSGSEGLTAMRPSPEKASAPPDFDQAYRVHVVLAGKGMSCDVLGADGYCDQWQWPQAKRFGGKHVLVQGAWEPRFSTVYAELTPKRFAGVKEQLFSDAALRGNKRKALIRPEYRLTGQLHVFRGSCSEKGMEISAGGASPDQTVCAEADVVATLGDGGARSSWASLNLAKTGDRGTHRALPKALANSTLSSEGAEAVRVHKGDEPIWQLDMSLKDCADGKQSVTFTLGGRVVDTKSVCHQRQVVDADGDGHTVDVDCDDGNSVIYPGATETCDFKDNDCDGVTDERMLADGKEKPAGLRNRCDECKPEPREVCDGQDNDCDGLTDEKDLDDGTARPFGLQSACGKCDEPTPKEVCDGADNDCDGLVDEKDVASPADWSETCKARERTAVKQERDGRVSYAVDRGLQNCCAGLCGEPPPEICDQQDNDCDGDIDEDFRKPDGSISCNCDWALETGEDVACPQVEGVYELGIGAMTELTARKSCSTDGDKVQFMCVNVAQRGKARLTVELTPNEGHSLDNDCFTVTPAKVELRHGLKTPVDITVKRKPVCGTLADKAATKSLNFKGVLEPVASTPPDVLSQFPKRDVHATASFDQWAAVEGAGLKDRGALRLDDSESSEASIDVTVQGVLSTGGTVRVIPAEDMSLGALRGAALELAAEESRGIVLYECGKPDKPLAAKTAFTFREGATERKLCLRTDTLASCKGGNMTTFSCNTADDVYSVTVKQVRILDGDAEVIVPLDPPQKVQVRLVVDRTIWSWFWFGGGWWWLVVGAVAFVLSGLYVSHRNMIPNREKTRALKHSATMWSVAISLFAATMYVLTGLMA